MNPKKPAAFPPRIEIFQDEEDWPEVSSIFAGSKIPQGDTEYLSLTEAEALAEQREREARAAGEAAAYTDIFERLVNNHGANANASLPRYIWDMAKAARERAGEERGG
jgi:hypothetical protein